MKLFLAALSFLPISAFAAGPGLTYHGRLFRADGVTPVSANVQFKIQIRSPGAENCLLWEETQNQDLTTTAGVFVIGLNDGSGTRTDGGANSFQQVLANNHSLTVPAGKCSAGTTYNPGLSDGRALLVSFNDGSGFEDAPAQALNYVPKAIDALQVAGFPATSLLRVADGTTLGNFSPLSTTQYNALIALANGTSTQYLQQSASQGSVVPVVSGSPSSPTQGSFWFDSTTGNLRYYNGTTTQTLGTSGGSVTSVATGAGLTGGPITTSGTIALDLSGATAGTFTKLTIDQYGRTTSGALLSEADIPTLSTAGRVVGSALSSGTIGGSTAINTSGNLATTGTATAATVSATNVHGRNIKFFDSGSNSVSLQAVGTLPSSYSLTLPTGLGSAGQILATDATGQLSWVAPNLGSVTTVAATAPLASSGGATPTVSIARATAGQDGYLAATDFATFNAKLASTLGSGQVWVGNGASVPTAVSPAGDVAMNNAGVFTATGLNGVPYLMSSPTASEYLKYNGTNWINSAIPISDVTGLSTQLGKTINASQMPANCNANQTLTFSSPTGTWSCSTILITGTAFGSQNAALVLAGPATGVAAAPTFRSLAATDLPATAYDGRYFKTGANSFGAAAILGTADVNSLILQTSAINRLTVQAGGNIGIGTASPATKLHVNGTLMVGDGGETCGSSLYGSIRYDGSNIQYCGISGWTSLAASGSGLTSLTGDVTASGSGSVAATVSQVGGVTAANVASGTNLANAATNANLASTLVKRDSSGNFVSGSATFTSSMLLKDGASGGAITLTSPTSFTSYSLTLPSTAGTSGQVLSTNGTGGLLSWATPTSSQWTPTGSDIYYNTGRVGFGTTSPNALVDAVSTSGFPKTILGFRRPGAGDWGLTLGNETVSNLYIGAVDSSPSTRYFWRANYNTAGISANTFKTVDSTQATLPIVDIIGNASQSANYFSVTTSAGARGNVLSVLGNGNVGIGTTAPAELLDVAGTVQGTRFLGPVSGVAFSFKSDTNTGMGRIGANTIGWYVAGDEKMRLDNSGNVGIGSTAPGTKLEVKGKSADATTAALNVVNSAGTSGLYVRNDGRVGIGTTTPGMRLDVNGDVRIETASKLYIGAVAVCDNTGCTSPSDLRYKENIAPLRDSLENIMKINGVRYDWIDKQAFNDKHQIGFIAQELEKIYPEIVKTDAETGFKSVRYEHLLAPLIEAFKTLHNRVLIIEGHQSKQDRVIASTNARIANLEVHNQTKTRENNQLKQENAELKARLDQIELLLRAR